MLDNDTLSFSGNSGQLFSISDSLTGTIFSVNDISGIPSIEVDDTGQIRLAQYSGNVLLGTSTDNGTDKLQISGSVSAVTGKIASATNTLGRRLELGYTPDVNAYIKTTATSTANSQNLIIKTDSSSWEQLTIRANGSNEIQGNTTFYGSVIFNQTPLTAGGENLSIIANTITGYPLMALTPFNSGTLILEGNPNPSDGTFPLGLVDVPSTFRVADRIISTLATGTAPFTIASTTLNTNLNADLLDGQHGSYYQQALVSGTNIKTINGSSVLGSGNLSVSGGISYTKKTSAYTAVDRDGILADTSGGSFTINLPASATVGMQVWIADDGSWATNNLTVDPNGGTIEGLAVDENLVLDLSGVQVQFIHNGTKWQIYVTYGSSDGGFVTLTGTQILTNKTLTSPVINTPIIKETVSVISGNTTAVASTFYVLTASLTLTLPSGPSAGDWVGIQNSSGVDTCVIARNGSNIMSLAENMTFDNTTVGIRLTYADATRGWVLS